MAFVDNFQDFIKYHADAAGMTREEYMAVLMSEAKKKPGPDPYHRGLEDGEVEDKEDQIKKQADMEDDDPDAYKEMPGDKEARENGEVKTSKATKSYNKLYGEGLDEGTMSDIHQMAGEVKSEEEFIKRFFKEYGAKVKKTKDSEEWAKSLYNDMNEGKVNEMAMGYDAHTGLFYMKGVPFTEERLEQVLKHLRTKVKLGDLPKQFSYFPAIQVADDVGGEIVTITLDKAKEIEATLKRFKGKLAHDADFNESVTETQKMTKKDWKKIKGFNKHITDSGEKFVMSYDDRIGTFLEPVEIIDEGVLSNVRKAVEKTKKTLKNKWAKKGGYENFGQDEIRNLEDKYDYNSMVYGTPEERKAAKLIDSLDQWAMNYVGESTVTPENPVNEEDDKDQKSTDRGPLDDDKIETALKKKAEDTGVPIGIIRAVMRRGLAAWKSGHRPGANQQQWGYARVNAFLTKGEGTWGKADKDLAKEVRDGGHDKNLKKA